jgi:tetratricopeptide (TPR) repeat protein
MSRTRSTLLLAGLAAVTLVLYGQTFTFDFASYDDFQYVVLNRQAQGGLSGEALRWAFTTFYASNWHPLTWLSHLLDVELFGLRPGGHHLTSVLFHAANTVLLAHLLTRLTGAPLRSAVVALLFAIHPLHVESVAYIAERKDVLSTFFGLLALLSYVRSTEEPGWRRLLPVVLLFAASLLAKPMLVTLPFLLLLLDWWPLGRLGRPAGTPGRATPLGLVVEKVPLFLLSLGSSVVTYLAQDQGGSVIAAETSPLALNLANAVVAYGKYLLLTVWPTGLSPFYPFPTHVPAGELTLAGGLLLAVTLLVFWQRRRPYLAVGWFWYLGTLVPVIGIVRVGQQALADRYTYFPLIGIFLMLVWGIADLLAGRRRARATAGGLVLLVAIPLLVLSWRQIGVWRDGITLFSHALRVTTGNWLAHHNLGVAYLNKGRYAEALAQFEASLRIRPNYLNAHTNLGNTYFNLGDPARSIAAYQEALRIDPDYAPARRALIKAYLRWGQRDLARAEYALLLRTAPEEAAAVAPLFLGR